MREQSRNPHRSGEVGKGADRLDDDDPDNDTIVIPVLKPIMDVGECGSLCQPTFNADGELDGDVMFVDFLAVRLDAVEEVSMPDADKPGSFIDIEILVGYVVRKSVGGNATSQTSGFVEDSITGPLQLVQ